MSHTYEGPDGVTPERCAICDGRRITCGGCQGHDPDAAAWSREWPENLPTAPSPKAQGEDLKQGETEESVSFAHHIVRLAHAQRWLAARLSGAEYVAEDEAGVPIVNWKRWVISLDPVACLSTEGVPFYVVLRRGETTIHKTCGNLPHLLNSVKKTVRENP